MSTHTYKKFEDVESGAIPDKMTIFQDCLRAFNASPVDAKKSRTLIARLLRLLYSGETFPKTEATTLFFSISKLFQHKDSSLRQIVYLAIKELSAISDDVLMVTSSIMKDVQNGDIIYKPNAIRTLARVLDGSTVHATERLMKTAIVDKHPSVSSAALVSSYHLLPVAKDVVKRWTNETQEAVLALKSFPSTNEVFVNDSLITQYHALSLLYTLRNHDKMALRKIIQQYSKNLRNPLAICQLIRYVNEILQNDSSLISSFFPLLQDWLNDRHHSVNLEAIKVVVSLPVTNEQFASAVLRLQFLLTAPKVVSRFAAVRILNRLSLKNPERIVAVNNELESLINDPNRSIATYAITTLLKTGTSDNIERLISTISKFINDISDEFKIIIIDAIKTLSLKFPQNYKSMLLFLVDILKDDGGFEFKNSIVEALFDLIYFVPESRDLALENLCEFIEDCEFTELSVRILNLLGNEGPKTSNPTLYIRHIYNRVVLENSIIRSAAVISLSKFALIDSTINKSIKILLQRIVNDVDDEVRDRAIISLKFLENYEETKSQSIVELTKPSYTYDLSILESKLQTYISGDQSNFVTPFDITSIPKISEDELKIIQLKNKTNKVEEESKSRNAIKADVDDKINQTHLEDDQNAELSKQHYIQELNNIEEFQNYGSVLHSSSILPLTEKETEFIVEVVKHIFEEHIVLQYNIENTLEDSLLEMVSVVSQPESEELVEEFILSIDKLPPHGKGTVYVSFTRPESTKLITTDFTNTLSFTSKECDPNTFEPFDDAGFEDEYQIEDLSLTPGDFILPSYVGNFDLAFDELINESIGTFQLSSNSIQETIDSLIEVLSLGAIEGGQVINESSHSLKLFGKTINGDRIGAFIKFVKSAKTGVTLKAIVKADDEELAETVLNGIA
ncbi:Coatomer subunit gamma-2 [Wickerhamomyces ciferrii]|uniref:Coatomer subunit gamma n=1 Tax=Wickerhamomyces ciferrii (strain ATCC 14091 / BCRC 22168 / CBS 111 / JCM 3599 / NBRC 0793 / NRRL Y-1031 F-60-10) TaxID=1206466 RepID=K0KN62_WICCF|nr:Coatomer subunit gamma-2 [Wickerhamomyces ciferrii]CCH44426.1 Coatomer subunit gamma-2 [Wickerhamomyces ciferrii]